MISETSTPEGENTDVGFRETWPHLLMCLCLVLLFTSTAVTAWNLGLGRLSSPAAGLWPLLASIAGLGLSVTLLVTVLLGTHDRAAELFTDVHWGPTVIFIAAVLGFLALYPLVGFLVAAIPLTFVLLKYAAGATWIPSIAISLVAPVLLYFIFREVLNVRF